MTNKSQEKRAIAALAALAQSTRMTVFRRLVQAYPDAIASGELARQCRAPHNTMSAHLAVLTRSGLISAQNDGRMRHYRADLPGFQSLLTYMLQDCCQGRAEICAPLVANLSCCSPAPAKKKAHV